MHLTYTIPYFAKTKTNKQRMNEYELSQNEQLTSYDVKDLNADCVFPYDDESFDKVTCVVSVDYLNQPRKVFDEIARVLR